MRSVQKGMDNGKISVIVPVYNVRFYIRKCLESIVHQTYENIEIILVDDGSFDGSENVCDEYAKKDSRVSVIHKTNGGLSSARNAGLDAAEGDYISFVDPDDYIDKFMYEHMIACFEKEVDVVTCNTFHENAYEYHRKFEINNHPDGLTKMYGQGAIKELLLLRKIDMSVCDKLFRKIIIKKYRFPLDKSCEDVPVTWNIIKNSKIVINNGYADYHYVHQNNSITSGSFFLARLDGKKFAAEILSEIRNTIPQLEEEATLLYIKFIHNHIDQIIRSVNCQKYENVFYELQEELLNYIELIRNSLEIDEILKNEIIMAAVSTFDEIRKEYKWRSDNNKLHSFYDLLLQWVENNTKGYNWAKILKSNGISNVAIYGMKELGEQVYLELCEAGVEVLYVIDKRKNELSINVPICSIDDDLPDVDAIIVTAITYFEEIKEDLKKHTDIHVINLADLIFFRL